MAKQTIGLGTVANDGTGDTLRTAGGKVVANFNELYAALGDGSALNVSAAVAAALRDWRGGGSETLAEAITAIIATLAAKLDDDLASEITDLLTDWAEDDEIVAFDTSDASAPKIGTPAGLRFRLLTLPVGTALATTGTVDLDLAALTGTVQKVTLTGDPTFTTSNRANGRNFELRLAAGAATRTITWPAGWVAFGAALPTELASGDVLALAIRCLGTADTDIDVAGAVSV